MSNQIENQQRRLSILFVFLCFCATILVARLAYWQIVRHEEMVKRADFEHRQVVTLAPSRGNITDRRGYLLATNATSYLIFAAPKEITEKTFKETADRLAPALGLSAKSLQADWVANTNSFYVPVQRGVPAKQADQIKELGLPGIHVQEESMRVYPADSLGQPCLGFANYEGVGANGIEGFWDAIIRGSKGSLVFEKDRQGHEIAIGYREFKAAEDGADLVLTLDTAIQYAAEKELRKVVTDQWATGGTILVMHAKTGAILACASLPSYNPNRFYEIQDSSLFVNPAVSQFWEPGSIFKIITMAAGLDTGVVGPRSTHNCNGQVVVDGQPIRTWNGVAHGVETMTQVLENSCNVGAVFVSDRLGQDRFYNYIRAFGLGKLTGVDLQGEVIGQLHLPGDREWHRIEQATNAFGQGLSVTPIQMAAAVAAVANGGVYMKPYVLERIESKSGDKTIAPKPVGRVISAQTARTLTDMLVSVVDQTGNPARIPGYRVAGKTGTAQVVVNGRYDPKLTITSFIGYAPADDPQFVILVKIDKPQKSPWASEVAAPVFHNLAEWLLHYLRIPPST